MANVTVYDDDERASVFAALTANEGNVKRTSRETGLPEQTVRNWKKKWDREGLPAGVEEALPEALDEFVEQASRIRNLALTELELQVEAGEVKARDLITIVGVLTDKVRLVQGHATSRTEQVSLGTPQEYGAAAGAALAAFLDETVHAAEEREADIMDAEWSEQAQAALEPPAT